MDSSEPAGERRAERRRFLTVLVVLSAALALLAALALWWPRGLGRAEAVERMNEGVALLEQYRYEDAYEVFAELTSAFPEWTAAWVNRGIAALNLQDEEKATAALDRALELDPRNPHALFSLGIQRYHLQRFDEARASFESVAAIDPDDPYAYYYLGAIDAERGALESANRHLRRALALQPSFGSAWYRLANLHRAAEDRAERNAMLERFQRLQSSSSAILVGVKYGEGGRYSLAVRDASPPGAGAPEAAELEPAGTPRFGEGVVFAPRARGRAAPDGRPLQPAMAEGDLTGDGALDLVLCGLDRDGSSFSGVYTPDRDTGYTLLRELPFDPLACALGDLDGDSDLDLVAAGEGWLRVLLGDGKGGLAPPADGGELSRVEGIPVRLYAADMDSDWDLDIVCLRLVSTDQDAVSSVVEVLNNNRDALEEGALGTFTDIASESGVAALPFAAAELAVGDWDGDIDLDILVLEAASGRPWFFANHRAWKFEAMEGLNETLRAPGITSMTGGDLDGDGFEDLVLFSEEGIRVWRRVEGMRFEEDAGFASRFGTRRGTAGAVFDFFLRLENDLLVLGGTDGAVVLAGSGGDRDAVPLDLRPLAPAPGSVSVLASLADGTGAVRLVILGTEQPATTYEWRPEGPWLGVELRGPRAGAVKPDAERANPAAIGATVEVRAGSRELVRHLNTGSGGAARRATRLFAGLAGARVADYVRVLWPDGVLQSELGLVAGRIHEVHEKERKPTSCPVLFAWDGTGFRFVADFLGVGGLGYFEAPGRTSRPDPTEILWIPRLEPRPEGPGGESVYALDVLEPLEECTYLDSAALLAVDHPEGTQVLPNEMFAVAGPAPGYGLLEFEGRRVPSRALDQDGRDVTARLLELDQRYAPELERDRRFRGVLARTHALELEFPDGIERLLEDEGSRPVLFLHGFIEYGYSTTNFAAFQAGFVPRAPTFSVERGGRWVVLREDWGFPGGYPRWMAVGLDGLLRPGDRRIRIETNLEIAWDQVFLAAARDLPLAPAGGDGAATRPGVHELRPARAWLDYRGFPLDPPPAAAIEGFPHGEFSPWEHYRAMPGRFTRYGDVRELLEADDDRFVVFGPGDGIEFAFRAGDLPPLDPGWRRSFFWKSGGYCKDMDLYTAGGSAVEPLPFRGMESYPYDPRAGGKGPPPGVERAAAEWNTRAVEASPRTPIREVVPGGRKPR